jgi:hypothetical protein
VPQNRASFRVVSPERSRRLDATAASLIAKVNDREKAVLSGPSIEDQARQNAYADIRREGRA